MSQYRFKNKNLICIVVSTLNYPPWSSLQNYCYRKVTMWSLFTQSASCTSPFRLDSLWCIFLVGRERGRSPCEQCRSSPLSGPAPPSARTSPWRSSSPPPSSPSCCSCRSSLLQRRRTHVVRCFSNDTKTFVLTVSIHTYIKVYI